MAVLKRGDLIGVCEVLALIGKGGMGEVYRAHDTKLKRDVAAKVLPSEFAQDPERVARASREAEVLASLNHANIAQIYGMEEFGGSHCLILEYVDGETLDERIRRAPLSLDEALNIAAQIAAALGAAHERGVVHRDLKPANVKIKPGGQVKVLDFGLAKVVDVAPNQHFSQSPTMLTAGTAGGVILGTTAYMSPEQARGRTADPRADIWAFGVVLFEMLTGKHAFQGDTVLEVLSSVLKTDPDWAQLPNETPVRIRALLRRCLQRDPNRRLQHIADARLEIEDVLANPDAVAPVAVASPAASRTRERALWIAALLLAVIGAVAATDYWRSGPPETEAVETRVQLLVPSTPPQSGFAVSPDGRKLVFAASQEGKRSQLWVRDLASDTARPLEGTETGGNVAWSPDSRSIAFTAEGKLRRVDTNGGAAQTIGDAGPFEPVSWGKDDVILFARLPDIYRMSAQGGDVRQVLKSPEGQQYRWPSFLPDGKRFLFRALATPGVGGTYLGSLDGTPPLKLLDPDANATFVPPDRILFTREGALFQVRLDLLTSKLVGDPVMVAPAVTAVASNGGFALFSGSTAVLAYRPVEPRRLQLTWFNRSGTPTGVVGQPDSASPDRFRISPDGKLVAIGRTVDLNSDIWVLDTARGIPNRATSDPAREAFPVWSPDSSAIAFHANPKNRRGKFDLYRTALNGVGDQVLLETPDNKNMGDWSPDGRSILFEVSDPTTGFRDLWVIPLDSKNPVLFSQSNGNDRFGRFSPNGRWVAFTSTETGRSEIYIQPFPGPGRRRRVTDGGGTNPVWTLNGKEISYIGPEGVMALPVQLSGDNLEAGTPVKLFTLPPGSLSVIDALPDGQKFLALVPVDAPVNPPINIILNWMNSLR